MFGLGGTPSSRLVPVAMLFRWRHGDTVRSASDRRLARCVGGAGGRRRAGRPAALLRAILKVTGPLPRATGTEPWPVHRRGCDRRSCGDLRAFARHGFDSSWLPSCSGGGSVCAAQRVLAGGTPGLWFSGSKVGGDERR